MFELFKKIPDVFKPAAIFIVVLITIKIVGSILSIDAETNIKIPTNVSITLDSNGFKFKAWDSTEVDTPKIKDEYNPENKWEFDDKF